MFGRKTIVSLGSALLITAVATTHAQIECSALVEQAVLLTEMQCRDTGRNQACHGYLRVEAEPQPEIDDFHFELGEIANLTDLKSIRTSPLSVDNDEWGVALLRVQANLPDTLPGENVTFLLFGDTELNDASVEYDLNPMQAVRLRTGLSGMQCSDAPQDGLLIQTPHGQGRIALNINGVNISLGSTVFFQAQPGEAMTVSTFEGSAAVEVEGIEQWVLPGEQLRIPMTEDLRPAAPVLQAPTPFEPEVFQQMPLTLLDRPLEQNGEQCFPCPPTLSAPGTTQGSAATAPVTTPRPGQGNASGQGTGGSGNGGGAPASPPGQGSGAPANPPGQSASVPANNAPAAPAPQQPGAPAGNSGNTHSGNCGNGNGNGVANGCGGGTGSAPANSNAGGNGSGSGQGQGGPPPNSNAGGNGNGQGQGGPPPHSNAGGNGGGNGQGQGGPPPHSNAGGNGNGQGGPPPNSNAGGNGGGNGQGQGGPPPHSNAGGNGGGGPPPQEPPPASVDPGGGASQGQGTGPPPNSNAGGNGNGGGGGPPGQVGNSGPPADNPPVAVSQPPPNSNSSGGGSGNGNNGNRGGDDDDDDDERDDDD